MLPRTLRPITRVLSLFSFIGAVSVGPKVSKLRLLKSSRQSVFSPTSKCEDITEPNHKSSVFRSLYSFVFTSSLTLTVSSSSSFIVLGIFV